MRKISLKTNFCGVDLPHPILKHEEKHIIKKSIDLNAEIITIYPSLIDDISEIVNEYELLNIEFLEISNRNIFPDKPTFIRILKDAREELKSTQLVAKLYPDTDRIREYIKICSKCSVNAITIGDEFLILKVNKKGRPAYVRTDENFRCVYQFKLMETLLFMRRNRKFVKPVIASGDIKNGIDVAKYLLLGADCVSVKKEYYDKSISGLKEFMAEKGYNEIEDFKGKTLNILDENLKK